MHIVYKLICIFSTVLILASCSSISENEKNESAEKIIDFNYIGVLSSKNGNAHLGLQYQDDNGCYWIKSDKVYVQVFEPYEYTIEGILIKTSIPRCG